MLRRNSNILVSPQTPRWLASPGAALGLGLYPNPNRNRNLNRLHLGMTNKTVVKIMITIAIKNPSVTNSEVVFTRVLS